MTTNYREILRLNSLGFNKNDIASAAQCACNTVSATLERANACGIRWPLTDDMFDKKLEEKLFPSSPGKMASAVFTGKIHPPAGSLVNIPVRRSRLSGEI